MNMAVVGAARVQFGADASEFEQVAREVQSQLRGIVETFEGVGRRIRNAGLVLTAGITVPFAAMTRAVDKTAGTFEGQMKRVEAALDNVDAGQLKALTDQARTLGPAVGKSATEAATGIEELGLAGLSTADILGGGLKATLDLAAAGMSEVAPAAGLVTDVMGQFKKTASDLPAVVQNVVGAMDASKFGFEDFQLAVAQGGGIAADAGVSFMDFATAVAATSTQFSSGSDAGTSFKTYMQSLVGNSDDAKRAMKKLGIEFFDASGRMKPLAEQAAVLREALSDLTDQSRNKALKEIFGADAARTAIGLINQGREGFERLHATVAGGDVEAKIAKRLEGSAAAGVRIANAWESVKISLGDTGLLDALTAIKNGFAGVLEAFAGAPRAIHQVFGAFAGFSALLGPLVAVLGAIGVHLFAHFVGGFGLLGRAISFIIAPVSTILTMLGEAGLGAVLRFAATRIAALLGPVGLAVGAFVLMKDSILPVLSQIYDRIVATLGPPLEAIMAKVTGIFSSIGNGPIAGAFAVVIGLLGGLADVIGTVVAGVLAIFGELLIRTLDAAVTALGGFVDVIAGVVDTVTALLTGDFAGAWNALVGIVGTVCDTLVEMVIAMVPDMEVPFRAVYEAAKAWLGDGLASVGTWVGATVASMVNYVASAFPNVVEAAKSVYNGVRDWLVDKFGTILEYVSKAAKFIGDRFQLIKTNLGIGGTVTLDAPKAPPAPKAVTPPPGPKRSVNFDDDTTSKKGGAGRKGRSRDASLDAGNREQLRAQNELEAARLRGDREAEQAIQDRLDLSKQIEAYQRTGLTLDQARVAAARDMKDLAVARAAQSAREIADERAAVALDVAQLSGNAALEESLSRQAELKKRIAFYYAQTRDLAEATRMAETDQSSVDAARLRVRTQWFEDDAADRAVRLAQVRGATDEEVRHLQRVVDIRQRARELERQGMTADAAKVRAADEWTQHDRARVTGEFRDAFHGGVQAAMDGDLRSFAKNWWKDRVAKGMEEAINSLADLVQKLFANLKIGSDAGGGGILGAIASAVGGMFGSRGAGSIGAVDMSGWGGASIPFVPDTSGLPRFATGGSFKVGGMSGIDRNVVSMRLSRGEMVDIRKPGNDTGPGGDTFVTQVTVPAGVDLATREEVYRLAGAVQDSVMTKIAERDARRA